MTTFQEELHLRDYINVAKRHKGVAILFFILVVGMVTAGSFIMTPVYRATATLFIDLESPAMLTSSDSVAMSPQNYYAYKEYYQSQKEIIKSRTIAKKVFDEYSLIEKPKYAEAKEPLDKFLKTVTVESVRDTRLLKLNVENEDPVLAAAMANRVAALYVVQNLEYISRGEYTNLLKNEYLKLQSRLEEETKVYKEKHPRIIRLREQIAQMAAKIGSEQQGKAITGTAPYRLPEEGASLDGLKANNVRVLDKADVPTIPVRPKKRLNVLLAVFVGLFGGIGLTFFAEYFDTTVKGEKDIERHVKMAFLGTVPRIESDPDNRKFAESEKDMICAVAPQSIIAEAYRTIRTNVLFSIEGEKPVKDIIITSPGPQEGKTTTSCNIAIVCANLGHKVLLIDGDLRKPRLHNIFDVSNDAGLSNLLSGAENIDKALKKTGVENLSVLPVGPAVSNPSEVLGSKRMRELLAKLREKFDIIFIDTPPVNVVTDAAVLAGFAGGVIIVVEGGRTMKEILSRTSRLLKNVRAQVLGVVVNNISQEDRTGYYYAHYYHSSESRKK